MGPRLPNRSMHLRQTTRKLLKSSPIADPDDSVHNISSTPINIRLHSHQPNSNTFTDKSIQNQEQAVGVQCANVGYQKVI